MHATGRFGVAGPSVGFIFDRKNETQIVTLAGEGIALAAKYLALVANRTQACQLFRTLCADNRPL